ncbi:hypothetical protein TWF718_010442 [Orbilia javanica]|uniref:Aminoglycoside phosphotransferase domain-containing protein n=1 Tax=Orbilia javanica TaxID=47235 RepID=A0AAN8MJN7_9PEZI
MEQGYGKNTESTRPATPGEQIILPISELPAEENVDFLETSFFRVDKSRKLPTPSEVRSKVVHNRSQTRRPDPVWFAEDKLVVKWGEYVTIAEGQVYWMIQNRLKEIPAPEIYGWRTEGNQVFLYLECIIGLQLEEKYNELSHEDKLEICGQIKMAKVALGRLRQEPDGKFLGSIGRQPLLDVICEDDNNLAGPFITIAAFHDWLNNRVLRRFPDPEAMIPLRKILPDNASIVFSHGDLHPKNILLSPTKLSKIVAIVDWHQSGWYPSYWERCKAEWGNLGDWASKYLPEALDSSYSEHSDELYNAFCMYTQLLGVL